MKIIFDATSCSRESLEYYIIKNTKNEHFLGFDLRNL